MVTVKEKLEIPVTGTTNIDTFKKKSQLPLLNKME